MYHWPESSWAACVALIVAEPTIGFAEWSIGTVTFASTPAGVGPWKWAALIGLDRGL